MYAGASGDFNPMHHDEVAAKDAGLPSVFGHGMFTMGLLGKALTDYVGVGNLERYRVRFTKQTWPGETLTTKVVGRQEVRRARRAPRRPRVRGRQPERRGQDPGRRRRGAPALTPSRKVRPVAGRVRPPEPRHRDAALLGRGQARHGCSSGTATRAASTTSTRGRSARSAGASDVEWIEASGPRHALHVVGRALNDLPPFPERVPYVAAVVDLEEGPRMMTNVVDCDVRRRSTAAWRSRWCSSDLRRAACHDPGVPAGAGRDDRARAPDGDASTTGTSRSRRRSTRCSPRCTRRRARGCARSTRCRRPTARPTS